MWKSFKDFDLKDAEDFLFCSIEDAHIGLAWFKKDMPIPHTLKPTFMDTIEIYFSADKPFDVLLADLRNDSNYCWMRLPATPQKKIK